MTTINKTTIRNRTKRIATSEAKSKVEIAEQSRDIMVYAIETQDIAEVNRFMGVLSPANCRVAQVYFRHFLPWNMPKDDCVFGKKFRGKGAVAKKEEAINTFLADPANTIWTWQKDNIAMEAKPKNYGTKLTKLVERALQDENEGLQPVDALRAIMNGGLDLPKLIDAIQREAKAIESTANKPAIADIIDAEAH